MSWGLFSRFWPFSVFVSFILLSGCVSESGGAPLQKSAPSANDAPGSTLAVRSTHPAAAPVSQGSVPLLIRTIDGLNRPFGILVGKDGGIYVCDFDSHRVLKYSANLSLVGWIGGRDDGKATDGWSKEGSAISGSAPGSFNKPHSIETSDDGWFYVTDYANHRVQVFDQDGIFISEFGADDLTAPASAYFASDGNLYVSDYGADSVVVFTKDGKFVRKIERGFNKPHMVRSGPSGDFYVADTWNHRILKFDSDWNSLGWIGAKADGLVTDGWTTGGVAVQSGNPGGFNAPVSIDLDAGGNMLVSEYGNSRVQLFSSEGCFKGWMGGRQDGSATKGWETEGRAIQENYLGAFFHPYDAKFGQGVIYVVDTHNNRIQVISVDG